jgi:hypothetical protein
MNSILRVLVPLKRLLRRDQVTLWIDLTRLPFDDIVALKMITRNAGGVKGCITYVRYQYW